MECIKEEYCYQNASDVTFKGFHCCPCDGFTCIVLKCYHLPLTRYLKYYMYLQAQSLQLEMNTNTNNTFIIESENHIIKMP